FIPTKNGRGIVTFRHFSVHHGISIGLYFSYNWTAFHDNGEVPATVPAALRWIRRLLLALDEGHAKYGRADYVDPSDDPEKILLVFNGNCTPNQILVGRPVQKIVFDGFLERAAVLGSSTELFEWAPNPRRACLTGNVLA